MVVVTRSSIGVSINKSILNVAVFNILIKYPYINVIWFFVLVNFLFLCIVMLPMIHVHQILRLPGAHMYITAINTVSNFTTCSTYVVEEQVVKFETVFIAVIYM